MKKNILIALVFAAASVLSLGEKSQPESRRVAQARISFAPMAIFEIAQARTIPRCRRICVKNPEFTCEIECD